nr:nuclear transport factor 2 (NTF2) superfamily protein [Mucilaginibacter sp. FT3.2]
MAVRYELESVDANERSFKTYGVQVFQFNDDRLIEMNYTSFNDQELI